MYQHLLVPIDGTPLSNATVDQAVRHARALRARVTFVHAQADYAATGTGALLHAADPLAFSEAAAGNARALLAQAEAAARASDVPCASRGVVHDRPHEAILEAARESGCDLIVMASHGRRGLQGALLGSVTHKVLQRAAVPVLVAAVESNLRLSDEQRAVAVIRDEHRSLAAVLHALLQLVEGAGAAGRAPDIALVRAMLFYIEQFPERLHHPKEDEFLFAALRRRTPECDALIEALQAQHREGHALFEALRAKLPALEAGEAPAVEGFRQALQAFAHSQWQHMAAEERLVLPAAGRHLQPVDWAGIAQAFEANGDPRFGADTQASFEQLARRLHNLAATVAAAR